MAKSLTNSEITWKSDGQLTGRTGNRTVVAGANGSCKVEHL